MVVKDTMESIILACDGGNIPQGVSECFSQVSDNLLREPNVFVLIFGKSFSSIYHNDNVYKD